MTKNHKFKMLCGAVLLLIAAVLPQVALAADAGNKGLSFPVKNRARVVNVSVETTRQPNEMKYKLDVSGVPETYRAAIRFYTVNALKYLRYTEDKSANVVITAGLTVSEPSIRGRVSVQYTLSARQKDAVLWSINAGCAGGLRNVLDVQYWFPGLVASCLPYYGQNCKRPHNVGRHPQYLTAVTAEAAK